VQTGIHSSLGFTQFQRRGQRAGFGQQRGKAARQGAAVVAGVDDALGTPAEGRRFPRPVFKRAEGAVGFEQGAAGLGVHEAVIAHAPLGEGVDQVFERVAGVEEGPVDDGANLAVGIQEHGGGLDIAVGPGGGGRKAFETAAQSIDVDRVERTEPATHGCVGARGDQRGGGLGGRVDGALLDEQAVHPSKAQAKLGDVVKRPLVGGDFLARGFQADDKGRALRAVGEEFAAGHGDHGHDGKALLVQKDQGLAGGGELHRVKFGTEKVGGEGVLLSGEDFVTDGLASAADVAEAEDAAKVVLARPEFVEHVGVAVVHKRS